MNAIPPVVLAPFASVTPLSASGGIPVTPGEGPTIATDRVDGQDYQEVKIALGGEGFVTLLAPGQKEAAASISVVLANDSPPIDVTLPPDMATEAKQDVANALLTEIEANQDLANALLTEIETNTSISPVPPGPATSVVTSVAASLTSVTILAANAARRGATVYNDSAAEMYLKLGAVASDTSFSVDMLPGSYFEVPYNYTGELAGIWAAATGNARVTELTA